MKRFYLTCKVYISGTALATDIRSSHRSLELALARAASVKLADMNNFAGGVVRHAGEDVAWSLDSDRSLSH